MESQNKTPLLDVLNNLTSIHHEILNEQTESLDLSTLNRIKLLAAQLYMEIDIELMSREYPDQIANGIEADRIESDGINEITLSGSAIEVNDDAIEFETKTEENQIELLMEEAVLKEFWVGVDDAEEVVIEEVAVIEEVVVTEEVVILEPVIEKKQDGPVILEIEEEDLSPEPLPTELREALAASQLILKMPMSRRFEFSNILFGGDIEKMGLFVQQMIDAPNAADRMDVYNRWFAEMQWRRRDESASDMLRMIKRILD